MILYESIGPNPRVVNMFIAEKKMPIERRSIDIMAGENRQADYLKIHPGGTTPALLLEDGSTLCETVAICEYLEERQPEPALIGETAEARARTRMWVRRIDLTVAEPMTTGFRAAEGRPMFEPRMRVVPAEAAPALKEMAADGLRWIEGQLGGRDWIAGERFTLADILLFSFVEFGSLVGQPLREGLPELAAWRTRVAARPSAAG